ncbi:MAG TPA: DUF6460 domain-containing protein [Devosiaceae bacterium]
MSQHDEQLEDKPDLLTQLLGDRPSRVIWRLVIVSLVVGFAMSVFGISPVGLWRALNDFINGIWANGAETIRTVIGYIATGALVVVPVWLILRIIGPRGRKRADR